MELLGLLPGASGAFAVGVCGNRKEHPVVLAGPCYSCGAAGAPDQCLLTRQESLPVLHLLLEPVSRGVSCDLGSPPWPEFH